MRLPSFFLPLLLVPLLLTTGCAAASAVGSALGAAFSGLAYFSNGNVERTFVGTLPEVWRASLTVLRLMDLAITEGSRGENAGELQGTAPDLTVTLTINSVTARATRVTIEAVQGNFDKDRATASEVLNQLALLLPATSSAAPRSESR
ncbi:MAG: DUF3568 family protein [Candidatus Methylomirabilales bacterium]